MTFQQAKNAGPRRPVALPDQRRLHFLRRADRKAMPLAVPRHDLSRISATAHARLRTCIAWVSSLDVQWMATRVSPGRRMTIEFAASACRPTAHCGGDPLYAAGGDGL